MGTNKKWKRTTRFLIGSFSLLLLISVSAFLCLGFYMGRESRQSIVQVGNLYMTGINTQISAHFQTLMNLKLEQLETAVSDVAPDQAEPGGKDELYQELTYRLRVRGFNYMALYSDNGQMEMLYGEQIQLADPEPFYESMQKGERKVAVGTDESGNQLVIFGVSAGYLMGNGQKSMALIAALPIEYISTMLNGEDEDALSYSQIIRWDGSFIVSSRSEEYTDYFSSLYGQYSEDDKKEIDRYIKELSAAMEKRESYSTILSLDKSRQQVYCNSLPYSEWQLVTVLPFGNLNEEVEDLGRRQTIAMMSVFGVILGTLILIFFLYYRRSAQQMKALERARQEALKANQAKSEFLSNMSHDIRTPMNAIVGMTAIAMSHIDDKDQVKNCLKKITMSGRHLLGLINDVLDMSKIESGKMTLASEIISLKEVIEGVVNIIQSQVKTRGQNFFIHTENILAEDVYCDSVRLNQVLLNLLSNAVKYTQEGGAISLSIYQEDAPSSKGSKFVRTHILVSDNGIGMTEEFLEHIYDSYAREDSKRVQKTEGAGLGMAITKYIVDAMQGTIDVKSEPKKGTEFHLTFDLEKAATQQADMALPAWRVLVIDDDEMLCCTAVEMLESMGVQAEWTLGGKKALEMVEQSCREGSAYQMILLDWKLPESDGLFVAKQIRKVAGNDVPIILISSYDWSDFEAEARAAGINGFIQKPLFKSTLYCGLKMYMDVEEEDAETDVAGEDMDLSGVRLLVAEDNEINWEILYELLSDMGMELEWAENGKVCLEKFRESEQGYYKAILMDIRMPVMNGYEATRAIRGEDHPDAGTIPIIAMTADAFSDDIQRCIDCGMNAHAAKPVNLEELVSLLKKHILKNDNII